MPIGRRGWQWFEPRLRSGSPGLRVALTALLVCAVFVYAFFGPLVFDAAYWVLGKVARAQADRRLRVGVSVAFAVLYLVAVSVSGSARSQSTSAAATPTTLEAAATNAASPSLSSATRATPAAPGTTAPTATTQPTTSPTATTTAVPSQTPGAAVTASGDSQTGASQSFKLAGGSYAVTWSATADLAGCDFSLILATKPNGPVVKSTSAILPLAQGYSGKDAWTGVPSGTYVLYEDWSGLLNCKGPWSATLTPD